MPKLPGLPALPPLDRAVRLRLALLVAILAALAGSLLLWDPAAVLAGATGPWRLPVAIAAYAVGTLAFVPKPALNAAAGLLLGVGEGLTMAIAATTLGGVLAFWLGRALGRDALRPFLRTKVLASLDRRLTEQGFRSVLLLRIVPGVPFQAANFGCAVSGVRFWPYTWATALGVAPGTAAYVVAGASAGSPGSPAFLISSALIVLMCVLTVVTLWRARAAARASAARDAAHHPATPVPDVPAVPERATA
ncbi:TVP38/TMEM64 family protein [Kitasatospora sp. MBT63]|uniref:TVP38/TMEM64 family protein n=1 Tax=Kitasatospora sp. MBT63 TaxID=1444768 RepID=UPI000AB10A92|nr:VTT domain-containing protein [Kitasatospora sp. MBT63]